MSSYFITGTDTGVGKTFVAASVLAAMRKAGRNIVPMKPVQTGCLFGKNGILEAPDLDFCLTVAGLRAGDTETYHAMCPFRFSMAASPHLAARVEGTAISIDEIKSSFEVLRSHHDGVLVEGAGGLLTPISDSQNMLDVMKALELPVVVVARPGLGTLNHSLLTVHELNRSGLNVIALVLNRISDDPWGNIEEDNLQTLRRISGVPVVVRFPFIAFMPKPRFADSAIEVFGELVTA
ncbi:MAG TPA: dethiobiotin synthase [Kiritimatiellia bacterium]|jgi:dethiobiotin synthetase